MQVIGLIPAGLIPAHANSRVSDTWLAPMLKTDSHRFAHMTHTYAVTSSRLVGRQRLHWW